MVLWVWLGLALAGEPMALPGSAADVQFDDDVGEVITEGLERLGARRFAEAGDLFSDLAGSGGNPDVRYLEALARYEGGELRRARKAAEAGLATAATHGPLLSLYGLILVDSGRGDDAVAVLDRAARAARDGADRGLEARVQINRGLLLEDEGLLVEAQTAYEAAIAAAREASDDVLRDRGRQGVADVRAARDGGAATDLLGNVAGRLAVGDIDGARSLIPEVTPGDRRARLRAGLAVAEVLRADGDLQGALDALQSVHLLALELGVVRETAAAKAALGVVYHLGGQHRAGLTHLEEAVGLVAGTSMRVQELAYRAQAGRVALMLDDVTRARVHLDAARERLDPAVVDPPGVARLAELEGMIWNAERQPQRAARSLSQAVDTWKARGAWVDAARVATDLAGVWAGVDDRAHDGARSEALDLWTRAGESLGEVHVAIATGLGFARQGHAEGAVTSFLEAAHIGDAVGSKRGLQLAEAARTSAAQVIEKVGIEAPRGGSLDDAVRDLAAFRRAERAHAEATAAYEEERYADAERGFAEAMEVFDRLAETTWARDSRRGRAWSLYNQAVERTGGEAVRMYMEAARDGAVVGDPELNVRARAAAAVLRASELGDTDGLVALEIVAADAERLGLPRVAGRCWSEVAEVGTRLDKRVWAAREAFRLMQDDPIGVYAMYSVAVDAYNDGSYTLARTLTGEVLGRAGDLEPDVRAVYEASAADAP